MKKNGVTLIELLIVMAVMAVVIPLIYGIYSNISNLYSSEDARSRLRTDIASAMFSLNQDLKAAKTIFYANNRNISFWVDGNENGIQENNEVIAYSFSGVTGEALFRTANSAAKMVLTNVADFTLSYDSQIIASIRVVEIKLTARGRNASLSLNTKIKPRNIF